MTNFRSLVLSVLYSVKIKLSGGKLWLGKKLGLIRSLIIVPYQGFGNKNEFFFLGRVIRDRGVGLSSLEDSRWRNFSRMYKRFMTWEIPFVRVRATFDGFSETAVTDEEGYFKFRISPGDKILLQAPWKEVKLTLVDQVLK